MAKSSNAGVTGKLEQHPLALKLVPGTMPEEEFAALCADLKKRGQLHDIITYEGKVLDGWHRYTGLTKEGITPRIKTYEGDDPAGFVIALNVLRRKLGATQRALAAAHLNLDYSLSQDEAAKRVGVAKLHVNLVVQTLKSGNARVIKMLERPELTRESLYEEMVESDIIPGARTRTPAGPAPHLSEGAAGVGLEAFFQGRPVTGADDDDDLLGDGSADEDLDGILGDAPNAGGKVLPGAKATTAGGMPTVGSKPQHPERRNKETPASLLAEKFRGLTETDQISFMQLTWHIQRKLLVASGVDTRPLVARAAAEVAAAAVGKAAASAKASPPAKGAAKGAAKASAKATPAKASAKG